MKVMGLIQWGAGIGMVLFIGYQIYVALVKKVPKTDSEKKEKADMIQALLGKPGKEDPDKKDIFEVIK